MPPGDRGEKPSGETHWFQPPFRVQEQALVDCRGRVIATCADAAVAEGIALALNTMDEIAALNDQSARPAALGRTILPQVDRQVRAGPWWPQGREPRKNPAK